MKGVKINDLVMRIEMTRNSMTNDTLREVTGISKATISAIRNGKSCSMTTVEKIAAALKISTADLLERGNEA